MTQPHQKPPLNERGLISKSTRMVLDNPQLLIACVLVLTIAYLIPHLFDNLLVNHYNQTLPTFPEVNADHVFASSWQYALMSWMILFPITVCFSTGISKAFLELQRTNQVSLHYLFEPFKRIISLCGAELLYIAVFFLISAAGGFIIGFIGAFSKLFAILTAVPVIFFAVRYLLIFSSVSFYDLIILDQNETAWSALKKSYQLARPRLSELVGAWLSITVVLSVGVFAALAIGALISYEVFGISFHAFKNSLLYTTSPNAILSITVYYFVVSSILKTLRAAFYSRLYRNFIAA